MTRRTHVYWDPTRRSSPVDHLVFEPRSNLHGARVPAGFDRDGFEVEEPEADFDEDFDEDLDGDVYGEDAPVYVRVPESAWSRHAAGRVALQVRSMRGATAFQGGVAGVPGRFEVSFQTRDALLLPKVKRLANDHGVSVRVDSIGINHFQVILQDPRESVGGLYRHTEGFELVPSTPADAGVVRAASGRSGYRGARDRLERGLFGPEERPKPDYDVYGMSPRYSHPAFGTFEGNGFETMIFGAVAVLATYRILGGKPLIKL